GFARHVQQSRRLHIFLFGAITKSIVLSPCRSLCRAVDRLIAPTGFSFTSPALPWHERMLLSQDIIETRKSSTSYHCVHVRPQARTACLVRTPQLFQAGAGCIYISSP
ncbi:unnamed protein product, partial [Ectocarpus sp. 12 AP-2014]